MIPDPGVDAFEAAALVAVEALPSGPGCDTGGETRWDGVFKVRLETTLMFLAGGACREHPGLHALEADEVAVEAAVANLVDGRS